MVTATLQREEGHLLQMRKQRLTMVRWLPQSQMDKQCKWRNLNPRSLAASIRLSWKFFLVQRIINIFSHNILTFIIPSQLNLVLSNSSQKVLRPHFGVAQIWEYGENFFELIFSQWTALLQSPQPHRPAILPPLVCWFILKVVVLQRKLHRDF